MIHIDIKKLGRSQAIGHRITGNRIGQSAPRSRKQGGKGWEYLHLAVDDHSRLAYSEILPDETRRSCLKFLFNALRFYRDHGVKVLHVMTDNGVSFRSLSSRKGVANAKTQAQAHQTLYAKNKRKGRTLRADLLAGMGEAGPRFRPAKPVGMAGGGLRQTLQSFIRTGRSALAFPPQL
jgi:Integrase core domain